MINQRLLGKCYEECFQYYEAVCFKTYPYEYQIILLKLAFFHKVNAELLMQVFGYSEKESLRILNELTGSLGALVFQGEDEYVLESFLKTFLQKRQTAYLGVGELNALYRTAYGYYYQKGEWVEAIRYADLNGDIPGMAACLHAACEKNEMYEGYEELETYMREIPESYIVNDPLLLYVYAYMEAIYGNRNGAEHYVHLVEKYLNEATEDTEEYQKYKKVYGMMQVVLPYQNAENLLQQMQYVEMQDGTLDCMLSISGGLPSLLHGGRDFCSYMMQKRETINMICGKCAHILREDYAGFEETILGEIAFEKGDMQEAVTWLSKGAGKANKGSETYYVANMLLVKIMYHRNQPEQAEHVIKGLERTLKQINNKFSEKNLDAFNVYKSMLTGQAEPVKEWVEYRAPREHELFITLDRYCYTIKIYAYMMLDKVESALMVLHRMLEYAKEYGRKYDELHMRILEMIICYRHGDKTWMEQLQALLEETESYGMVRIYADRGNLIYPILKKYEEQSKKKKDSINQEYFDKVMEHTKKEALLYPNFLVQKKEHEALSEQEIDVLRLLCQGMRNADIAGQLFLSENTVKYHLKKIYQKLSAGSRSEAITRARELDIV